MYEALNRPIPNLSGYLKRIGLSGAPSADLAGLNALIWAHQTHIPFEDLNTSWLHLPVSLEIPALYDKVVVRRRGGYCYELNALFTRLLLDLGFDARSVFCRVVRGRDFLPPCAHRAVVVALEGKLYFCDVGFGGPMPAGALEIADGVGQDVRGEYFCIDRFDDYWWTVSRNASAGVREAVLQFNTLAGSGQSAHHGRLPVHHRRRVYVSQGQGDPDGAYRGRSKAARDIGGILRHRRPAGGLSRHYAVMAQSFFIILRIVAA